MSVVDLAAPPLPSPPEFLIEVHYKGNLLASFTLSTLGRFKLLEGEETAKVEESSRFICSLRDEERGISVDIYKVKDALDEHVDWLLDEVYQMRKELGYEDDDP